MPSMGKDRVIIWHQIKEIKNKLDNEIKILGKLQDECNKLEVDIKNKNQSLKILNKYLYQ